MPRHSGILAGESQLQGLNLTPITQKDKCLVDHELLVRDRLQRGHIETQEAIVYVP